MTGAKNRDGQDIPLRRGSLSFVMTKMGEKQFIAVIHNMNLLDPP